MRRLLLLLLLGWTFVQGANHSVTLSWTWAQGTGDPATGFHIQRSQVTGGPYAVIATVPSSSTLTFIDSSVVGGQTYFYVVTAFNGGGDSLPSNQVTCNIPFQPPMAPSGLQGNAK